MTPPNSPEPQPPKVDTNQIYPQPAAPAPIIGANDSPPPSSPSIAPSSGAQSDNKNILLWIIAFMFGGIATIVPFLLMRASAPTDDPAGQKKRFRLTVLALYGVLVGLPGLGAIFELVSSPGDDGAGWAALGLILMSIISFIFITIVLVVRVAWKHSQPADPAQPIAGNTAINPVVSDSNLAGQPDASTTRKVNFLFIIGLVLLAITVVALGASIILGLTSTSSFDTLFGVFALLVSPVIDLLSIGLVIWGLASIKKEYKNKRFYIAIIMCLSPYLIWLGFLFGATHLKTDPGPKTQPSNSQSQTGIQPHTKPPLSLSFIPYIPDGSAQFTLSADIPPQVEDRQGVQNASFYTILNHNEQVSQIVIEFAATSSMSVNKSTTSCFQVQHSAVVGIDCSYAFTTPDGTAVFNHSEPIIGAPAIQDYFMQKGQTYIYIQDGHIQPIITDYSAYVSSLKPSTVAYLNSFYNL